MIKSLYQRERLTELRRDISKRQELNQTERVDPGARA